ncbi:MAG: hypothetical protein JRJ21_07650 [Deltaproteobacteria bacterium]|nr:hypothetical protein [Deltaproteobacteria bacterium]
MSKIPPPGGVNFFGPELKAEGLMGCPFDPAQGKRSPLYACPVAMKGYHL